MKTLLFKCVLFGLASGLISTGAVANPKMTIEESIIIMRHGIRSPSASEANMYERLTTKDWPKWEAEPGGLTEHSQRVTTLLGAYYKIRYQDMLPKDRCPTFEEVFAWSNSGSSRTADTSNALMKGMFPECDLQTQHLDTTSTDPLFFPVSTGKINIAKDQVKDAVLTAMGGSIEKARVTHRETLDDVSDVVPCCHISTCETAGLPSSCKLKDLPWYVKENGQLGGGINMASTLAEQIRMSYAEGMPLIDVGWGAIKNREDVKRILAINGVRTAFYDGIPYVASKGGSQLLKQVLLSLTDGTQVPVSFPRDGALPSSKLLILAGHDPNLVNVRALIGVHWSLEDYPDNDTGPSGAIVFDRLKDQTSGKQYLQISYITPRLDVLRNELPMTGKNAPEVVKLAIPACKNSVGEACELSEAIQLLSEKIDIEAIW